MKYVNLGRSGLVVSRLCMGTLNFGPYTLEPDAFAIMERAHALGVNYFDTANSYGSVRGEGETETIIGRWFARGGGRRERTVLGAKVYGHWGSGPNEGGLSALAIRRACEASLKRLQTDYLDVLQLHHFDETVPVEETWEVLDLLRQQGKVVYFGASNFASWNISQAQEVARARHMQGLVSHQSMYNLIKRGAEREIVPVLRSYGIGLLAWSPLHRGMLAGLARGPVPGARFANEWSDPYRLQLDRFEALCTVLEHDPAQVALAWLLSKDYVNCVIIGPQSLEHLDSAVSALENVRLETAHIDELEVIFPPATKSPDDYFRPF